MDLIKIFAVCLIATVLILLLNQYRGEYALLVSLSTGTVLLLIILAKIYPLTEQLTARMQLNETTASCVKIAAKTLGIAFLSGFVADTCRDFGQSAMASRAELAGKCAIFLLSLPLLFEILDTSVKLASL